MPAFDFGRSILVCPKCNNQNTFVRNGNTKAGPAIKCNNTSCRHRIAGKSFFSFVKPLLTAASALAESNKCAGPRPTAVAIPKKDGGVRITINYNELNAISSLRQLPIPRVDQVLDSLGTSRIFSLFDMVSSFHQITIDTDTIPLMAFCTPDRLFEWLVMPQSSSAPPGLVR